MEPVTARIFLQAANLAFVFIALLLIISVLALGYSWLMKKRNTENCNAIIAKKELEKNLAILQSKQEERTRISADLHDDLGAGLTSIRLYSELAKERGLQNSPEITKISSLSNQLINRMNAIIWTMDQTNDSLVNLLCYLRKTVIEYLENTGIDLNINNPGEVPNLR